MKTLHLSIIAIMTLGGISLIPAFADESDWHVQHVIGKFLNSNPLKPDQVFNFQYKVVNGTLAKMEKNQYGQFEAKVTQYTVQNTGNSVFELRIPRNYPYSNMGYPRHNDTGNINGTDAVIEMNGIFLDQKRYSFTTNDCFFEYSIPFTGKPIITLGFITYPESIPYEGDKVPGHCMSETTVMDSPLKQLRQGTKVEDIMCQPNLILILNHNTANVACVRPHTLDRLASVGWTEVRADPKLLHMSIHVSGSYIPLTLQDHFLRGSLKSQTGPISNATISISANGVPMGTTQTFPDGCFQFNNWDEKKFSPKIDEYVNQDRTQVEHSPKYILFSARYLGDENHYATSAQASSYLYLSLPPIAPAMYMTEPQSLVENLTQGNTTQFQLEIKSILKQSEIDNPHLVLQPTPCGLDYDVKPIGDGSITQDNGGKFIITLKASNYVPSGKYFVRIFNNSYPTSTSEQYLEDIGGFVLNVVGK